MPRSSGSSPPRTGRPGSPTGRPWRPTATSRGCSTRPTRAGPSSTARSTSSPSTSTPRRARGPGITWPGPGRDSCCAVGRSCRTTPAAGHRPARRAVPRRHRRRAHPRQVGGCSRPRGAAAGRPRAVGVDGDPQRTPPAQEAPVRQPGGHPRRDGRPGGGRVAQRPRRSRLRARRLGDGPAGVGRRHARHCRRRLGTDHRRHLAGGAGRRDLRVRVPRQGPARRAGAGPRRRALPPADAGAPRPLPPRGRRRGERLRLREDVLRQAFSKTLARQASVLDAGALAAAAATRTTCWPPAASSA